MRISIKFAVATLMTISTQLTGMAQGGILKSLDDELTALVERTEPYLVTVKGESDWRNLIATGIVFDKDGHVLTSSHAYDSNRHEVIFKDGVSYQAEKVGVDHQSGLAVLKISADNLRQPLWGNSEDLRSGAWIMVVGNSYGTPATVNFGIYEGKTDENFLKLGVGVSPGASGGAVLNIDGQIVGALIARQEETGIESVSDYGKSVYSAARNLRFFNLAGDLRSKAIAVPIEQALDVARELIENGRVRRGYLGISQRNLTSTERQQLGIDHGVMVVEVVENSPADSAGLEKGDIVTSADRKEIGKISDLYTVVRSHKPGDRILIEYSRDGEEHTVAVVLDSTHTEDLFGAWQLKESLPKLKVGQSFQLPGKLDLQNEVDRLESQLKRLEEEIEKLRDKLEG